MHFSELLQRPRVALLSAFVVLAPTLSAERLVHEVAVSTPSTSSSTAFALPLFPPTLGNLRHVEVAIETRMSGTLQFENVAPQARDLRLIASRRAAVASLPGVSSPFEAVPLATVITEAPAYDGTTDFAGSSGRSVQGIDVLATSFVRLDPASFAAWTGAGTQNLTLQVTDEHEAVGATGTPLDVTADLETTVRVTYLWTPAEAEVRTLTVSPVELPWIGFELFDSFPAGVGELEKVEIQIDAVLDGTISFESIADVPGRVDVVHGGFLDLRFATATNDLLYANSLRATSQYFVDAFDLLPDNAGISGAVDVVTDRRIPIGGIALDDPFLMLKFLEPSGQFGMIFEAQNTQFVAGPGGAGFEASDFVQFELTVVYQYSASRERFCIGNGGETPGCTPCPCFNNDFGPDARGGCMNSIGRGAELFASGDSSVSNDGLRVAMIDLPPGTFALLASANNRLPGAGPCPPGSGSMTLEFDGLRCVGGSFLRHGVRVSDQEGQIGLATQGWGAQGGTPGGLALQAGFLPGTTRQFQAFFRDNPNTSPCGNAQNTSNGLSVTYRP